MHQHPAISCAFIELLPVRLDGYAADPLIEMHWQLFQLIDAWLELEQVSGPASGLTHSKIHIPRTVCRGALALSGFPEPAQRPNRGLHGDADDLRDFKTPI